MRVPVTAAAIVLALHPLGAAVAQVGHLPETSPYKDMRIKQTVSLWGGYLSGGRGTAGVAPSGGRVFGARWNITLGAPTVGFVSVARAELTRNLVNPTEPEATRLFRTADQDVYIIDGGFNLVFTGRKTWRGLAPYLGASMGMAFGASVPEDSVFQFDTKFQIGPALGVRFHPSRRVNLRFEARDTLWRVNYGKLFFEPPPTAPDETPVLDPVVQKSAEWTHHLTLVFAVAYTLRL